MRKVVAGLDEEQKAALRVLVDFGVASFSAGLAVEVIRFLVNLVT